MKRKTLTLTLSILACLALIGVGFASWIISANTSDSSGAGSFIVDEVKDRTYTISGQKWVNEKSEIIFSAPTGETTNGWLTNDSTKKENLSVTYQITVQYGDGTAATGLASEDSKKLTAVVTAPGDSNYQKAISDGLIVAPTNAEVKETETAGVYEITVTYQWGSHFDSKNPYAYYNAQIDPNAKIESTEITYLEDAKSSLKTLEAIDSSVKFTLTINIAK